VGNTSAVLINRHDYQQMPEGPPYFQVIEGDLVRSPANTTFHQSISCTIAVLISNFLGRHRQGEVYQPDVFFVSEQRRSIVTDHGIEGAPDLIVETLSPTTARYDKGSKRKIYARHGVREFWLVDPETRAIQVYLLGKDAETPVATHGDKAAFESVVLPGRRVKTAAIFKSSLRN
jgi:Uma2 family endonuclease